eukprot:364630-Chlamydomonas_euryale.AAC.23
MHIPTSVWTACRSACVRHQGHWAHPFARPMGRSRSLVQKLGQHFNVGGGHVRSGCVQCQVDNWKAGPNSQVYPHRININTSHLTDLVDAARHGAL